VIKKIGSKNSKQWAMSVYNQGLEFLSFFIQTENSIGKVTKMNNETCPYLLSSP
jgi:hypothetical protein